MSAVATLREEAEIVCGQCAAVFRAPAPSRWSSLRIYCDDCSAERRRTRERERKRHQTPEQRLQMRARCHAWAQVHRGVKTPQPWLAGAPPFATYLPGGYTTVTFTPRPTRSIRLEDTRGLHGALTALLDRGHEQGMPNFSLAPGEPWGVYWWREAGLRFANREVEGALWDRPTRFRFGPLWRVKAPTVEGRGKRLVRVETITPVVSRAYGSTVYRSTPTSEVMHAMLAAQFAHRLGLSYLVKQDLVRVQVVESRTEARHVDCGAHLGIVVGWVGHVDIETNAPARWLLRACERVGLGGRTAFGFGRIRVTELARQ